MEWWQIGILIVAVLVVIYFVTTYLDKEDTKESFSDCLKKGDLKEAIKAAEDPMQIYEAYQTLLSGNKLPGR